MKLKQTFVTHTVADSQVMVPVGESAENLHGFVRSNETAAFIVDCFKQDVTFEQAVEALLAEYEVDRPKAEAAVQYVVDTLKKLNAFEE